MKKTLRQRQTVSLEKGLVMISLFGYVYFCIHFVYMTSVEEGMLENVS